MLVMVFWGILIVVYCFPPTGFPAAAHGGGPATAWRLKHGFLRLYGSDRDTAKHETRVLFYGKLEMCVYDTSQTINVIFKLGIDIL